MYDVYLIIIWPEKWETWALLHHSSCVVEEAALTRSCSIQQPPTPVNLHCSLGSGPLFFRHLCSPPRRLASWDGPLRSPFIPMQLNMRPFLLLTLKSMDTLPDWLCQILRLCASRRLPVSLHRSPSPPVCLLCFSEGVNCTGEKESRG